MNVPDDRRYSSDHEWIQRIGDSDVVRVGITDYAQDSLGDVVFVEAPEVGQQVAASDSVTEVESTKSVSDIYAPVSGVVKEANDALDSQPELLNSDPYGDGWICAIQMSDPSEFDTLLDAAGYRALTDG
ncbi:MAG: glycine cleavage system protein GcvH [Ilumatobacter sp.]|jgi:glycine cleavage system H protein|uniref:glycine cleavage system protein GcvH n=1 Tax=Ilumatobacter sp. TaxID=1967498 RepID=UPI00391DD120